MYNLLEVQVNAPIYVLNVTTEESGNIIGDVRVKGQPVFGEVLASSLGIVGDPRKATLVTSPIIRSRPETPSQLLGLLAS